MRCWRTETKILEKNCLFIRYKEICFAHFVSKKVIDVFSSHASKKDSIFPLRISAAFLVIPLVNNIVVFPSFIHNLLRSFPLTSLVTLFFLGGCTWFKHLKVFVDCIASVVNFLYVYCKFNYHRNRIFYRFQCVDVNFNIFRNV